jgi:hypothetical protein
MSRLKSPITLGIGVALIGAGIWGVIAGANPSVLVPVVIGICLVLTGWHGGRRLTVLLGHVILASGCFLTTLGIYLLPHAKPDLAHIFGFPLFWGLFSIFGGICTIYHGFCRCVCGGTHPSVLTNVERSN